MLVDALDLLYRLFTAVLVPQIVRDEISRAGTPPLVREWIADPPPWLQIVPTPSPETLLFPNLDIGERTALALAVPDRGSVQAAASVRVNHVKDHPYPDRFDLKRQPIDLTLGVA